MSFQDSVRHPAQAGVANPVVLVLDASETMSGRVAAMFEHIGTGFAKAAELSDVFERVRVGVVLINRDQAIALPLGPNGAPFVPVAHLALPEPPVGEGVTPLHEAVHLGLDLIEEEHQRMYEAGTMRGVATLIIAGDGRPTDRAGHPTDDWRAAAERVRDARGAGFVLPAALAFGEPDRQILRAFAPGVVVDGDEADLAKIIERATITIDRAAGGRTPIADMEASILQGYRATYKVES